jgi:DNA primase
MAGRISQAFIDDLLDRVDVVEVVGARLDLRKAGKNYTARCPFHDEKTPSFSVSPDKQFFYCFGCGAGGNAIGFVMDYDHVDFPTAVAQLASHAGLSLPAEAVRDDAQSQRRDALHAMLGRADHYYREQLRDHPAAPAAVTYLKQRGVSGQIARDFGIGLAPPGWDNLLNKLGGDADSLALLKECGLLVEQAEEGRLYDRFRHRIMFPIRDTRGRTLGFGARVLGDDKPKYLNSPETSVFHKGRELYGLYEAQRQLRDNSSLLLVEGYMDVVALAQHGIVNAVATLGTAATAEQLGKAYRYTSEVVFCFDGDAAGRQAARRALETCLPLMSDGRSARFLFLPDGEDPDSLVRKIGAVEFRQLINSALPLSQFLFDISAEGLDLTTPDHCARFSQLVAPLLKRIPLGVFHQLMVVQLAERTGIEQGALAKLLDPVRPEQLPEGQEHSRPVRPKRGHHWQFPQATQLPARKMRLSPVQRLIALLVNQPAAVSEIADLNPLKTLELPDIDLLLAVVELLRKHPDYSLNHILGYWRGVYGAEEGERLAGIAAVDLVNASEATAALRHTEMTEIVQALSRQAVAALPPDEQLDRLLCRDALGPEDGKIANEIWLRFGHTRPELVPKIREVLARSRKRDNPA